MHVNIPNTRIKINELESEKWYIIQKICDILFSEKYNEWAKSVARSILDGIIEYKGMTWKQDKLIMDIKPNIEE